MSKRLALFEQLIEKGSRDPFHHYGRAMELRSLGRSEEALAAFEALVASFADYVPSYLMAAQLATELARPGDARRLAEIGLAVAQRVGDDHAASELASFLSGL